MNLLPIPSHPIVDIFSCYIIYQGNFLASYLIEACAQILAETVKQYPLFVES